MTDVWTTPLTPLAFLGRSADVFGDKTAIVYGARRHTYTEFAAEATRVARALQASGVQAGDRVAYLLPNVPEMLIAHFAVPLAGVIYENDITNFNQKYKFSEQNTYAS